MGETLSGANPMLQSFSEAPGMDSPAARGLSPDTRDSPCQDLDHKAMCGIDAVEGYRVPSPGGDGYARMTTRRDCMPLCQATDGLRRGTQYYPGVGRDAGVVHLTRVPSITLRANN